VLNFVNEKSIEATHHNDIRSLWSLLPGCLASIRAKFQTGSDDLELKVEHKTLRAHEHHKVSGSVSTSDTLMLGRKLQTKADVLLMSLATPVATTGQYTSFAAYRYAIKGRINNLPVHTVQRRIRTLRGSINCRKCKSQPETPWPMP